MNKKKIEDIRDLIEELRQAESGQREITASLLPRTLCALLDLLDELKKTPDYLSRALNEGNGIYKP